MQTAILASGEKLIHVPQGEVVRVTSDLHLSPSVWTNLAGHALRGTRPEADDRNAYIGRFGADFLERPEPNQVEHQVINGDFIHSDPLKNGQLPINHDAWRAIETAITQQDITGEHLTLIPGNHSLVTSIPPQTLEHLSNRGIVVPEGKARIIATSELGETNLHVRHGHEFQPKSRHHIGIEGSALYQGILSVGLNALRGIIGVRYFPYGNSVTQTLNLILNAPQMIRAEAGLKDGEWAIDGHTHFVGIQPPNGDSPEPEVNLLSKDYLEKVLYDSTMARAFLKLAAKVIPDLAGIDKWYVTSHNGIGYANSGFYDPLSQVLSALDVRSDGIDLILANVNGGYEQGMMRQKEHNAISKVESHHFKPVAEI